MRASGAYANEVVFFVELLEDTRCFEEFANDKIFGAKSHLTGPSDFLAA